MNPFQLKGAVFQLGVFRIDYTGRPIGVGPLPPPRMRLIDDTEI
jgi:hypothetical protein